MRFYLKNGFLFIITITILTGCNSAPNTLSQQTSKPINENLSCNLDNAPKVALGFAEDIYTENIDNAKLYAEEKLWPEIDLWLDTHESIDCPQSWVMAVEDFLGDNDTEQWQAGCWSNSTENIQTCTASKLRGCQSEENSYYLRKFQIRDLELICTENQWLITKWTSMKYSVEK